MLCLTLPHVMNVKNHGRFLLAALLLFVQVWMFLRGVIRMGVITDGGTMGSGVGDPLTRLC